MEHKVHKEFLLFIENILRFKKALGLGKAFKFLADLFDFADFILDNIVLKWKFLVLDRLCIWRSCVRDGSGNPFCHYRSVFCKVM